MEDSIHPYVMAEFLCRYHSATNLGCLELHLPPPPPSLRTRSKKRQKQPTLTIDWPPMHVLGGWVVWPDPLSKTTFQESPISCERFVFITSEHRRSRAQICLHSPVGQWLLIDECIVVFIVVTCLVIIIVIIACRSWDNR